MEAKTTNENTTSWIAKDYPMQFKNSNTDIVHMKCVNQGAHEISDRNNIHFRFVLGVFCKFLFILPPIIGVHILQPNIITHFLVPT